ncbi:hypothetical protein FQN60_014458 [Etheostoma spectabile]|uniref:Uncharacterized protein n=1 Tax=Etheostoma spectabile TaxID=54343 RepID=A0A5J5DAK2_9PERO|nr:hypothetical protein FQN60_014458 [Etheostoma spectabile]
MSCGDVAAALGSQFRPLRGFSGRSVRRWCAEQGLVRDFCPDSQLEVEIADSIAEGARNLNPIPYYAQYMGHKLHVDQNEKLVMFGVTHVMAIDGFSKKVVSHFTMPIKNNILIYEEVYRPAVLSYGLWDQNHVIERMWSEVNARVNYPLKTALVEMVDQEEVDMEDNTSKYCVSNLTCQLARIGITKVTEAWNAHRIPGKGIPNELAKEGCPAKIPADLLPVGSVAADLYHQGPVFQRIHFWI